MHVTQAHGADRGSAAQYRGRHGAHVQGWAEVASGDQKLFVGLGLAHAEVAENQHRSGVNEYDE